MCAARYNLHDGAMELGADRNHLCHALDRVSWIARPRVLRSLKLDFVLAEACYISPCVTGPRSWTRDSGSNPAERR
jgi:hypothetical protein